MNLKLYRMGVKMQEQMQRMMGRVSGEGAPPPAAQRRPEEAFR